MKKLITRLQMLQFSLMAFLLCLGTFKVNAQAAPWCDGQHPYHNVVNASQTPLNYYCALEQVVVRNGAAVVYNAAADGFNGGQTCGLDYKLENLPAKAFDLTAGNKYFVDVSTSASNPSNQGYGSIGAYIDFNNNKTFTDPGEFVASWTTTAGSGPFIPSALATKDFIIPCNVLPSATRLRIVCNWSPYPITAATGCWTCSNTNNFYYGETKDFSINLLLPTSVSANFIAPTQAFVRTVIKFINNNQVGYTEHAWDVNNDGSFDYIFPQTANSTPDYSTKNNTWTTTGTKCLKLRSTNCLGKDSIVKCVDIVAPNVIPKADFIATSTTVEMFGSSQLFDLSSDGPYLWKWNVYDSTTYANTSDPYSTIDNYVSYDKDANGVQTSPSSQNPIISFEREGTYCVELISTNGIGSSSMKKKCGYITVTEETKYYLGYGSYGPNSDNLVGSSTGTIIDDGFNKNYTDDQGYGTRSYLQITPCNALKINLTMTQLKIASGDVLSVYDGTNERGTLLAAWSFSDRAIKKVTASSGSMFILFRSDGAGNDSGYVGTYISELGAPTPPKPDFITSTDPGYNSTPLKFFNTTSNISGVPTWEWTVDGSLTSTKKEMQTRFLTDGQYDVCLEIKSCVGNQKTCKTVTVITPATQSKVDFTSNTRRPSANIDRVTLTPIVDNANFFSWTIFPTTYTLLNPPTNPSKYGAGFINYRANPGDSFPTPVIKFTTPGCYTVTLKAWNENDSTRTAKSIVKNKYICAVDYCKPSAYILSSDVGINRVKILDGTTELLNNFSQSGIAAYTNYASNISPAILTYGKIYTVEVSRNTTIDAANRAVWIDWNIDGDFSDPGEKIFTEASAKNAISSAPFQVPTLANSFEGLTKMRVAANYNNNSTTECGPLQAGEYEDYSILLVNDNMPPKITLKGADSIWIEKCFAYSDLGAVAIDGSEGDITSRIKITSDLDSCTNGVYTIEYNVTDASGNKAVPVKRTIVVIVDKTAPILTLNPGNPGCLEARRDNLPYSDPGATAKDPNNNTDLTPAIITTGLVNNKVVGNYTITYTVQDAALNQTIKTRNVCVTDTEGPKIDTLGPIKIQINSLWVDQTTVADAYDNNPKMTTTWGITNGPVNTQIRASYPVTYTAIDSSGNMAIPRSRTYRVDDFIPPTINLNTFEIVYHEVREPYLSVTATASDNYYLPSQVSLTKTGTVDQNVLGTYYEVFEATDGSLNVTTRTRTVIVRDTKAPSIWAPIMHACVGDQINPMWEVSTKDNYYSPAQLKPLIEIINQNVDPTNEGLYTIIYRVTDPSNNVSDEFTRLVYYSYWPNCFSSSDITAINNTEDKVNLYPNPSTGLVTIDLQGVFAKNATVNVYNTMGQVVMTQTFNEVLGKYEINLTNQASGIYTIKMMADGQVITKRVTLVH